MNHLTWCDLDTYSMDGSGSFYKSWIAILEQAFPPAGTTLEEVKDRLDLLEATRDAVLDYMAYVAISVNFYDRIWVPEMLQKATARLIAVTAEIVTARAAWCDAAQETGMWCPPCKYQDEMAANLETKFPRSVPRSISPATHSVHEKVRWSIDSQNAEVWP